jgi:hypothetical protein
VLCLPALHQSSKPSSPAAKSRNEGLIRQLLKHQATLRNCAVYPEHWFEGCAGNMYLRNGLTCCYAALAAGDVQMLRQLLLCGGSLTTGWRSRLLLCYAARRSNAECLQEVLIARQVQVQFSKVMAVVAPQHLAMAAARNDPWAAGGQCLCVCMCFSVDLIVLLIQCLIC